MRLLAGTLTVIALAFGVSIVAAPPAAALPSGDHRYALRVLNRDGTPAPDDSVVFLARPLTREERRVAELTNVGPPPCAVLSVQGGFAQFHPKPGPGCESGSRVSAVIDFKDGTYPITAEIEPAMAWHSLELDGPPMILTVRPIPPRT